MSGEGGEVDPQGVQVHRLVRNGLAGVQHYQRTHCLGAGDELVHRGQCARHVGMVTERHNFDAFVELQRVQVDAAGLFFAAGDPVPLQRGAGTAGQLLPRDQVGVVFQFGGDDDVAGPDGSLEPVVPQHIGEQVKRLGGVLGEHQLIGIGTDERRDVGAALLVGVGRLLLS